MENFDQILALREGHFNQFEAKKNNVFKILQYLGNWVSLSGTKAYFNEQFSEDLSMSVKAYIIC